MDMSDSSSTWRCALPELSLLLPSLSIPLALVRVFWSLEVSFGPPLPVHR
jgi:hypothetical protein